MASANFIFLSIHDAKLVTLGGLAERYFRDDPSTANVKLRQLVELMAKLIAARNAAYRDEREMFEETLRRPSYERIIPKEVADVRHWSLRSRRGCERRRPEPSTRAARLSAISATCSSQPNAETSSRLPDMRPINRDTL